MKRKLLILWYKFNILRCTVALKFYSWLKSFCDKMCGKKTNQTDSQNSKLISILSKIDTVLLKFTGVYLILTGIIVIVKQYSTPIPAGLLYIIFGFLFMIARRTK